MSEDVWVNRGDSTDGVYYPRPAWWPAAVPRINAHVGGYESLLVREIWIEDTYRVRPEMIRGGTVIDLGANVGVFALLAAHHGARRVIACEPNLDNYRRLVENIALNPSLAGCVEPLNVAVHAFTGTVCMDGAWGAARVTDEGEDVRCVSLADLIAERGEVAFLKVDVEGSEFAIFDAATVEITARCRHIAMELHATDAATRDRLVAKIRRTHRVEVVGSLAGGSLYATRHGT